MRRVKRLLRCLVIVSCLSACSGACEKTRRPLYIGLDYQVRSIMFREGFGRNLLDHKFRQPNVYFGYRFLDSLAIEIGYEETLANSKISKLFTGEMESGMVIQPSFSPIIFKTKIKVQGPYFNIVLIRPIYTYKSHHFEFLGSAGFSFLKMAATRETLYVRETVPHNIIRSMSGRKKALRLTTGVQYRFCDTLSVRGSIGWIDTRSLVLYEDDGKKSMFVHCIKPRKTVFYGFGIIYHF